MAKKRTTTVVIRRADFSRAERQLERSTKLAAQISEMSRELARSNRQLAQAIREYRQIELGIDTRPRKEPA